MRPYLGRLSLLPIFTAASKAPQAVDWLLNPKLGSGHMSGFPISDASFRWCVATPIDRLLVILAQLGHCTPVGKLVRSTRGRRPGAYHQRILPFQACFIMLLDHATSMK